MSGRDFDPTIRRMLVGAALLGIALPLADGLLQLRKTPPPAIIDARYAAVRAAIGDELTLGYLSDFADPNSGTGFFWRAQYALAPIVLVEGDLHRLTLANLHHPAKLQTICRQKGLTPVIVDPAGVALLRPEGER